MNWNLGRIAITGVFLILASGTLRADESEKLKPVAEVLDGFHEAASQADGPRYFGYFAAHAVFIGTDVTERWSVAEFRSFADPYFSQGRGWTYIVNRRNIQLDRQGLTAWFDEVLDNESYGTCRGTGVLVFEDGEWKIVQYHLTIPIPNDIAKPVVAMIRSREKAD